MAKFGVSASTPFPNLGLKVTEHSPLSTVILLKNIWRLHASYKFTRLKTSYMDDFTFTTQWGKLPWLLPEYGCYPCPHEINHWRKKSIKVQKQNS